MISDVKVKNALHEILKENTALLKNSKSLMAKIEELAPSDYMNLALFRSALLKANIGEFIAARDIENPVARDKVKFEAIELLKKQNLSEENSENIVQQILDAIPQNIVKPPPPPPPKTAEDYYSDGVKALASGYYAEAMASFNKAIEIRPTFEAAYNARGTLYATKKEYHEAISDFSQVIRYNSENASAYRNRGMRYYELKNYKAALTDFEKLLQLNPNDKEIEDIKQKILNLIESTQKNEDRLKVEELEREKREHEEMKSKIAIILLCIAMLFTILLNGMDAYKKWDSKVVSKTESSKITKLTAIEKSLDDDEKIFMRESSETSLDGIEIGMKTTELISIKGGAKRQDEWLFPGYTAYDYGNAIAVVKRDRVCAVFTNLPSTATKKGIHPGSSDQELKKAYGSTSIIYFNNRLYEFTAIDGQKCYVGFVVSNGAVAGIKIAVKDVYDFWSAFDSLTKFHELITKRDYDSAYDYFLTENMRNKLGNYDNWRAGYKTTVKSEIKRINSVKKVGESVEIDYDLEATDNPGGTRYFTGKALINKNGGWWAIDNMVNK